MLPLLTSLSILAALAAVYNKGSLSAFAFANSASSSTPSGFVNNGTIGTYLCAVGQPVAGGSDIEFVSGQTLCQCPDALQPTYPFNKINIASPDDSIRATFIPHGATMTEFWVKDRNGLWRDIVLGYDNVTNYATDPVHPYLGPQVGRYANRIKNGTFTIDSTTYHVDLNDNNGLDTLHGGAYGYDRRPYTIESLNASHVSFILHDPSGEQGFPGSVVARASYTLGPNGQLDIAMDANVTEGKTPVMLSHHGYWALHAYGGKNDTIYDLSLHMPYSDQYVATDGILIPTGPLPSVTGTPLDFTTAKTFGQDYAQTQDVCGGGCQGWDNCWILGDHKRDDIVLTMSSPETGIQMDVRTDQSALQVYTCNGVSGAKGSIPRKRTHGGDGTLNEIYENHSCVVIEAEDYIDGINNPQWGRDQIYSPDRPYHWRAEYTFSTIA